MMKNVIKVLGVALLAAPASAAVVQTTVDANPTIGGTIDGGLSANEYGPGNSYRYQNGGGSGFGGTVGGGSVYMKTDGTDLFIGWQPGGSVGDVAALLLDTRSGGFTDAAMNDTADGGRNAVTNINGIDPPFRTDVNDSFQAGFLPDFGVAFGGGFIAVFELNGGSINFIPTSNNSGSFKEVRIPLATLGVTPGSAIDFLMGYTADSGYGSNESLPFSTGLNSGANVGASGTSAGFENINRFIPSPGAAGLLGLATLTAARRRRA